MRVLNEIVESKDGTRKSRIISYRGGYIAKRVFRYRTSFGDNSTGFEVRYQSLKQAIKEEDNWINKTK